MADLIKATDNLNEGRIKLNKAITDTEEALTTAKTADEIAKEAKTASESTQEQLNKVVIEGDSSVEAAQARVNNSGTAFPTLKQRLDTEHQEVTAQLQKKPNKGEISVTDIDKNKGKLDQTYLSDELLQQMTGNTPINVVPADNSLVTKKFVDKSITPQKISVFNLGVNLFDKNDPDVLLGQYYDTTNILKTRADWGQTGFIPVKHLEKYTATLTIFHVNWYDANKNFLSATASSNFNVNGYVSAFPVGVAYARFAFYVDQINEFRVEQGEHLYVELDSNIKVTATPEKSTFFKEYPSVNLFNKNDPDVRTDGYYAQSDGTTFVSSGSLGSTGFIPVTAGKDYTATQTNVYVVFYNADKTYNSSVGGTTFDSQKYVTAPADSAYARFVFLVANIDNFQVQEGREVTGYEPFGNALKIDENYLPKRNDEERNYLTGKKFTYLGDSLSYRITWQPYVVSQFGLIETNAGIGSTTLAGTAPNAFWQDSRLDVVKNSDPDILTILGGANDLATNILIGDTTEFEKALLEKNTSVFMGAYSYIIENLLAWKPSLRIIILGTSWAHNDGNDLSHTTGLTYTDFSNASNEVAQYYGLPFVDLHGEMGLNKMTVSLLTTDNIHWSDAGGKRVAELVIDKIEQIKLL